MNNNSRIFDFESREGSVSDTDPYYNDKVLRKIAKNAKFAQLL